MSGTTELLSKPSSASRESSSDAAALVDWPLAYEAEKLLREAIGRFLEQNSFAARLAERMRLESGTDVFEWVDHLVMDSSAKTALIAAGLICDRNIETPNGEVVYEHPRATLPRVLLRNGQGQSPSVL